MSDFKFIISVLIVVMLGPFASDSYLPSLPQMTEYFGTNETLIQLSVTLYFMGMGTFQLLWGPLSDKVGRKKALILGGFTALIGCGIAGFASSPWMLNFGRFVQGAGGAANASLGRSTLRDRFNGPRLSQAIGMMGLFFALIPSIAPLVGGLIQQGFGWRANFIFLFLLTLFIILYTWRVLPETHFERNHRALDWDQFIGNYKQLLSDREFWGYTIGSSMAFSGLIAYYTVSPFLLQTVLGMSPAAYGLAALAITGGLMGGHFTNAMMVKRMGIDIMLKFGYSVMLFAGLLFLGWELFYGISIPSVIIATLFYVFGACFAFVNGSVGAIQRFGHIAGSAAAMYGFLQIMGTTIVSLAVAWASDTQGYALSMTYILTSLVAFLSLPKRYKTLKTEAREVA